MLFPFLTRYLLGLATVVLAAGFFATSAQAGVIVQAPKYVGLEKGLVGFWSFDGPALALGRAPDMSGNGNEGKLTNGPARAIGKIGQALNFSSSTTDDDYVSISDSDVLDLTGGEFTISAWIYPRSLGENNQGRIIDHGGGSTGGTGWTFQLNTDNALRMQINAAAGDGGTSNTNAISLNTWQHVVVTRSGNTLNFYTNASNVGSASSANPPNARAEDLRIGLRSSDTNRDFNGLIDDVRIYNRVLSPDEIKRLYRIGATAKINMSISNDILDDGLMAHWTFDGQHVSGTRALDRSGQGKHAVLSAVTTSGSSGCPGGTDTYSTAGSFSWPSSWSGIEGCTSVNIQAWGGGGAGGVATNGEGGGGGGAYSAGAVAVSNGTGYTAIVGAAGTTADAAGGDSSFKDASTILAKGGALASGATGGAGGQASSGVGTTKTSGGSGGNGAGGNPSGGGGGGCSGTAAADGGTGNAASGGTGGTGCTSSPGAGGAGGDSGVNGTAGTAPGGGGGGGGRSATAASGAAGRVIVSYDVVAASEGAGQLPVPGAGKIGQGIAFDGASSYIDVGNVGSGVKTISFWIKANNTTSRKIFDIDGTDQVELNSSSEIAATSFPGATEIYVDGEKGTAVDSRWHHVVITDTTGVNASAMKIATSTSQSVTAYFDGTLDDIRLYDRVLSQDEIKRLYKSGSTARVNTTITTDSLQRGLVGHWSFDGPALALGRAPDSSGNGNEGKLTNGPVRAAGKIGQGLEFFGTPDNMVSIGAAEINSLDPGTKDFSISTWVKVSGIEGGAGTAGIFSKYSGSANSGFYLTVNGSQNEVHFRIKDTVAGQTVINNGTFPIIDSNWHHVVVTADRDGSARIYIDTVLDANGDISGNSGTVQIAQEARIGDLRGNQSLIGIVDDVRYYERLLSLDEIKRLYNMGR